MLARQLAGAVGAAAASAARIEACWRSFSRYSSSIVSSPGAQTAGAGERAARVLRDLLDVRQVRDPVDHVVEAVVRAHPLDGERAAVLAGLARAQRPREAREALLGRLELVRSSSVSFSAAS